MSTTRLALDAAAVWVALCLIVLVLWDAYVDAPAYDPRHDGRPYRLPDTRTMVLSAVPGQPDAAWVPDWTDAQLAVLRGDDDPAPPPPRPRLFADWAAETVEWRAQAWRESRYWEDLIASGYLATASWARR